MFKKQVLLIALLIGLMPFSAVAAQDDTSILYVIQPGDTLFSIARRYDVALDNLAQYNGLLNPSLIFIGQEIQIPITHQAVTLQGTNNSLPTVTPLTYRIHVVQTGENLFRIALKYQVGVEAIATANELNNTALIFVGQELTIPIPADAENAGAITNTVAILPDPFLTFDVGPLPVAQGGIVVVKVRTREPVTLQGSFINWVIPFSQEGDLYYGVVGVSAHPTAGAQPGIYPLTVTASDANGTQVHVTASVQVTAGRYNSESIILPPDRQNLLDPILIQEEREKLNAVWTIFNPVRRWNGPFALPVENFVKISSPFGTRRSYDGGPYSSYHEGTDFSALRGTAVYAPANGVIALAEPLTVRGNAIVIDHGWGIFTGLYHLSSIDVSVGQLVSEGDFIGRVGSTGLSTGPHLHWDVRVRSLNVDPLQLTRQALP